MGRFTILIIPLAFQHPTRIFGHNHETVASAVPFHSRSPRMGRRLSRNDGQMAHPLSGRIAGTKFETWLGVDNSLRHGLRGLPGGSSLARFLAEKRDVRNIKNLPPLTDALILKWADEFHERTGSWPSAHSGTIPNSGGRKIVVRRNGPPKWRPGPTGRLIISHAGRQNELQA